VKPSRLASRLALLACAAPGLLVRRSRPETVRRILVAHHLLLGDTLMLTALLARLRRLHPQAEIVMTVPPALLPLYATHPYGVLALPWSPHDGGTLRALLGQRGFDLAYVPGDPRHALLARALGARWIVAQRSRRDDTGSRFKAWLADELVDWADVPTALADSFALLAGRGDETYAAEDWPAPPCAAFAQPRSDYAVLHVGAGSPLRLWPAAHWRRLAEHLEEHAVKPLFTCGPGEAGLIEAIDPQGRHAAFAGTLDLAQLWHLLAGARLAVCLDSGISHLTKLTATPTVVLYGPGSPVLFGPGAFWRDQRFHAVWDPELVCRDQHTLFKNALPWVRRCQRSPAECAKFGTDPRCMLRLPPDSVIAAADRLLLPSSARNAL
jgi:ADP-heptose:LPS heptosyltransferase